MGTVDKVDFLSIIECNKRRRDYQGWLAIGSISNYSRGGLLMKIIPSIVLFTGFGILVPTLYYIIFRKKNGLINITAKIWAITGFVAFILFPAFLFRKHWEAAMVFAKNTFWFVAGVAQMDNNFWETLAKLLAIVIFLALTRKTGQEVFQQKSSSTIFGCWVGLCYGIGEAITLSIIGYFPVLNRIFGIGLFMYFTTWYTVWERAYAVQIHALIGALIGIGLYHWFGLRKRWWLLLFFIFGMLYHELVDGTVLVMMYFPRLAFSSFIRTNIFTITLPVLVVIGYLIVFVSYRASRKNLVGQETIINRTQEVI